MLIGKSSKGLTTSGSNSCYRNLDAIYINTPKLLCSSLLFRFATLVSATMITRRQRVTQVRHGPPYLEEACSGARRSASDCGYVRLRDRWGARHQRVVVSVRLPALSTSDADADDL